MMGRRQLQVIASDWDFFAREENLVPRFYMVDLGLKNYAPIPDRGFLVQVEIILQEADQNGLTRPSEAEVLFVLEDYLSRHLAETVNGIYAGRITGKGKRSFYFYCQTSVDIHNIIAEVTCDFEEYQAVTSVRKDAGWQFYQQELYPNPGEYYVILQRRGEERGY